MRPCAFAPMRANSTRRGATRQPFRSIERRRASLGWSHHQENLMKAIVQDRYGSADVLQLKEIERPRPSAREVIVRVRAAGVDFGVWHLMEGVPYAVRLAMGLRRPRNPVRGLELAGVVEEV